ncbi:MAG: acyltransferase [Methanobrevibacter sp.]|nr:acyltransferase family protein [Methanobrevibacter sp.]MBE6490730.1 acyltransferase [Methanobrevibacter sp.]
MQKNQRIEYISLASVLSAIAVVFLHANVTVADFNYSWYWLIANIIHSAFIFAVPVFFMISGAMLLDFREKYDLKTYFSKRINKTVLPYIFWSIAGLLIQVFILHYISLSDVTFSYFVSGMMHGNLVIVYWFFIPLFALYLLFPLCFIIKDNKKLLISSIFLLFIINYLISSSIPGYLAIALTGYYIHKYGVSRRIRILFYILLAIGFFVNCFGTYYLSLSAGKYVAYLRDYTSVSCVLYSVGVFILIKYDLIKFLKKDNIKKIISYLDHYTFAIYLIHWYIIQFLIVLFNIDITSIIFRLLSPFVVIVICVVIINVLRKVPVVSKIVP